MEAFHLDELINGYLKGTLDDTRRAELEEMMANDPLVKRQFREQELALYAINSQIKSDLKKQLLGLKNQQERPPLTAKTSSIRRQLYRVASAASILLLFWVGGNRYAYKNYSNEVIIGANYKAPSNELLMSMNQPEPNVSEERLVETFKEAHENFKSGKYDLAISDLNAILASSATPPGGMDSTTFDLIQQDAAWTKILAQLAMGQEEESIHKALEQIATNSNHPYQDRAIQLRAQLQSFWRKFL